MGRGNINTLFLLIIIKNCLINCWWRYALWFFVDAFIDVNWGPGS